MLDETDRKIVALLGADGRLSNNEIARRVGLSEGTIRNRLRNMADAGEVKVAGQVHPDAVPEKQLVLLGINVGITRDLKSVAAQITDLEGVQATHITSGRYDIVVEVWLDVKFGLIDFIGEHLGQVDGVVGTESFLVMKSYGKWISKPGFG